MFFAAFFGGPGEFWARCPEMILRLLWVAPRRGGGGREGFLYAKLNSGLLSDGPRLPTGGSSYSLQGRPGWWPRGGLAARIVQYGEAKWHGLARFPASTIRGRIYLVGNALIGRVGPEERMLWRVYEYCASTDHQQATPALPRLEVPCSVLADPAAQRTVAGSLRTRIERQVVEHRRWRLIHGLAVIPALCLSILPFVKLWLAWEVFRAVTHHRAYRAARWLQDSLGRAGRTKSADAHVAEGAGEAASPLVMVENTLLEEGRFEEIDEELPSILRKIKLL